MKTYSSIVFALFLAVSVSAEPKCERLEFYDLGNLQASFEQDLTSNVWRSGILGTQSTLYFGPDGMILAIPDDGSRAENYTWSVIVEDDKALLHVYSHEGAQKYSLAPTCSGLSVNGRGKAMTMEVGNKKQISDATMRFMESRLAGTWEYLPEKGAGPKNARSFTLILNEDGTFKLAQWPDTYHSQKDGIWQLSPDGEYLILFTRMYLNGKERYVAESIQLFSLDFEDLVINGQKLPGSISENTNKQPLYLSKQGSPGLM